MAWRGPGSGVPCAIIGAPATAFVASRIVGAMFGKKDRGTKALNGADRGG